MPSDHDRRILVAALNEITELIAYIATISYARAVALQQDQDRIAERLRALQKDNK